MEENKVDTTEDLNAIQEPPKYTARMQRRYICEFINDLTYDEIGSVYRFLSTQVTKDMFNIHGSGCSINLDKVSDNIILSVYNLVWNKQHES